MQAGVKQKAISIFDCEIEKIVDKNGDGIPDQDDDPDTIVGLMMVTDFATLACDLWELCWKTKNGELPRGIVIIQPQLACCSEIVTFGTLISRAFYMLLKVRWNLEGTFRKEIGATFIPKTEALHVHRNQIQYGVPSELGSRSDFDVWTLLLSLFLKRTVIVRGPHTPTQRHKRRAKIRLTLCAVSQIQNTPRPPIGGPGKPPDRLPG